MRIKRSVLQEGFFLLSVVLLVIFAFAPVASQAASAKEIEIGVDDALERFKVKVVGGKIFLKDAKGVLVFPEVYKAGFGFGGEYGEGAMRIDGKTVEYYNTMAASIGWQLGAQARTVILAFMTDDAIKNFRNSDGWKAGVDGSVTLLTLGVGDSLDTTNMQDPIIGFTFDQKGLMYNLTFEGSKFTKIVK